VLRGEGEGLIVSPSSNSKGSDGLLIFKDRKKVAGTGFELLDSSVVGFLLLFDIELIYNS
jgi:hypothetical protein